MTDDELKVTGGNSNESEERELSFEALSARDKRSLLFHILYVAEAYDYQMTIDAIVDNLNRGFGLDIPFDSDIVYQAAAIVRQREDLDSIYKPFLLHWRFDRIGVCTRLILRYGVWELINTEVDITIIMNEAIELAKCYAERDAYKFINGVLDEVAKKHPRAIKEPESSSISGSIIE
jgi:N utilization substance protein B